MSQIVLGFRPALLAAAGLLCLTASPGWALTQNPETVCDALAASPFDPQVPKGEGVPFEQIKFGEAVAACEAALANTPGDPKLLFQYARALDAAGRADEAIAAYTQAIDAGSVVALSGLGTVYDGGYGVPEDATKAAELYQRAADAGLSLGMTNLGNLYEHGRGVAQDYAKAAALYKQAADAGSAFGAGSLGYLTEKGLGVAADDAEAARLYRIGADGGEAFAQRNMGVMYSDGRGGLDKNPEEAFRFYKMAADQHFTPVYVDLSKAYRDGIGTPADETEAVRYLRLAIEEGDAVVQSDAQNDLAWLFSLGNRNLDEAETLARAAVAADPQKALKLDTLAWVLHLQGRDAEALPLSEKAVELDGASAENAKHLAIIRASLPG